MGATTDAIQSYAILIQAGVSSIVVGQPGPGKTANTYAIAKALNLPVKTFMANIHEPGDLGLPVKSATDDVIYAAPRWAKELAKEGRGLIFLDELSTASPAMHAACMRVIHERIIGELELPPGVTVTAAMNPADEAGSAGNDLPAPLANRLLFINWPHGDAQYWSEGMVSGWPEPQFPRLDPHWRDRIQFHRSRIAAFIHHRPELLHKLPQEESKRSQPWPSERSWDMSATVLAAAEVASEDIRLMLLSGAVGTGPAAEYFVWTNALDLPDPEECLRNPDRVKVPKKGDQAFALFSGVSSAVISQFSWDRFYASFKVFDRARQEGKTDLAMSSANAVMKKAAGMPDYQTHQAPRELTGFYDLMRRSDVLQGHHSR